MKVIDNINNSVKTDLLSSIKEGSKLAIAASNFSIYVYKELKAELEKIEELRFIFTAPTFIAEKSTKESREYYVPRLDRERNLFGSDYEIKLRNELSQKTIAKECAEWIRRKVIFKSNITRNNMSGFMHLDNRDEAYVYTPLSGFTTSDLGCSKGDYLCNIVNRMPAPFSDHYIRTFNELWKDKNKMQDVTEEVIDSISEVYKENSPEFIYYVTLYNIFNEFLEDISEDVLPDEATGFKESKIWSMLYNFQQDAVLAIINKLEKFNGCILADSVGLGKTFTALAVIKYYENRNKSVLVLCPKKLTNNWNTYKDNYINNPIASDRLNYDVLFHTDLTRNSGKSNGLDLDRLNWENYNLIIIDESHNFRSGGKINGGDDERENRYVRLMNKVIRKGVKTKVLMLSATPVNNRFNDLKNQLQLAYEGDSKLIDEKLDTSRPIDEIFKRAQTSFNKWSKYAPEERTASELLGILDSDFFSLLDSVTIARSRKHIERYYDTTAIGQFPARLKPISLHPSLTDLNAAIGYNDIFTQLLLLNLSIYRPSDKILPSRIFKYSEIFGDNKVNINFTQANREKGIQRLMAINLMKRMESSVHSFRLTLNRMKEFIDNTINIINNFHSNSSMILDLSDISSNDDFDAEDMNSDDIYTIGKKVKIDLADMDYISWSKELKEDAEILELLSLMIDDITPKHDSKLQMLLGLICNKITKPINGDNKKIIIFTAFADTAEYLYNQVSGFILEKYQLHTAMVTGSVEGRTTVKKLKADLNMILTCFSPISKDKELLMPNDNTSIDILIATDCISEGQNLQDCDYLINYDIHWNPVRIIQRFGRIDRIGSHNNVIQLVNFWPDLTLDEYINLKSKVETRMKIVDMTATGDDNLLSEEEKMDLEYRKQQLERLQKEVVNIEDMSTGISIMDLGLNEFRLDLLAYIKDKPNLDRVPYGIEAVIAADKENQSGVVYVLKNRSDSVNIDNKNRLHPFYVVYITDDGEVLINHLDPKDALNKMRLLCKGKVIPDKKVCAIFNKDTREGRNMKHYSSLLGKTVASIVDVKEESDIDSFLSGDNISFKSSTISGLDDFELICFLIIK